MPNQTQTQTRTSPPPPPYEPLVLSKRGTVDYTQINEDDPELFRLYCGLEQTVRGKWVAEGGESYAAAHEDKIKLEIENEKLTFLQAYHELLVPLRDRVRLYGDQYVEGVSYSANGKQAAEVKEVNATRATNNNLEKDTWYGDLFKTSGGLGQLQRHMVAMLAVDSFRYLRKHYVILPMSHIFYPQADPGKKFATVQNKADCLIAELKAAHDFASTTGQHMRIVSDREGSSLVGREATAKGKPKAWKHPEATGKAVQEYLTEINRIWKKCKEETEKASTPKQKDDLQDEAMQASRTALKNTIWKIHLNAVRATRDANKGIMGLCMEFVLNLFLSEDKKEQRKRAENSQIEDEATKLTEKSLPSLTTSQGVAAKHSVVLEGAIAAIQGVVEEDCLGTATPTTPRRSNAESEAQETGSCKM